MRTEDLLARLNRVEETIATLTPEVRRLRRDLDEQMLSVAGSVLPKGSDTGASRMTAPSTPPMPTRTVLPSAPSPRTPPISPMPAMPRRSAGPTAVVAAVLTPAPAAATRASSMPSPPLPPLDPAEAAPRGPGLFARAARWLGEREMSDLLGARVLAWAGGAVTLLGIVFFFVLAVNRGLIGPEVRVGCGASASALVFGAGFWLRSRQGESHAGLAAVGAGIAGSYATVLAAAGLYGLVPDAVALLIAALIAAVGVATSLAWSAQPVAGLGLVGAMAVPVIIALEHGGPSVLGTAFVVVVLAATCTVALVRHWRVLLQAGLVVSLPQLVVLVAQAQAGTPVRLLMVATAAWLMYVAAAVGWQGQRAERRLLPLTGTLALVGVGLAYGAAERLFDGADQGWILLATASVYAVAGAALLLRRFDRDLTSLLWASGAALAALGLADVLSGPSLALAWSVQAALLAWLSSRAREPRFLLVSTGYLGLAFAHVLRVDAQPAELFVAGGSPASGLAPLAFAVCAALVFVVHARPDDAADSGAAYGAYQRVAQTLTRALPAVRGCAVWSAASAALYAACLSVMALSAWLILDERVAFERGHVAVSALLSTVALAAFATAVARGSGPLRVGALIILTTAATKAVAFDRGELPAHLLAVSLLAVGASAALTGLLRQRSVDIRETADPLAALLVILSGAACVPAALLVAQGRWHGVDLDGASLLALGAGYGLLAGLAFAKERDLFTLLGALSVTLTAVGAALMLSGTWLVVALAVGTAGLALLANTTREPRLLLASGAYLAVATVHALAFDAPPADLFTMQPEPARGVPALALVAGAALVLASKARHRDGDRPFRYARQLPRGGAVLCWLSAAVTVYAASLALLAVAQTVTVGDPEAGFLRGHVAVNALWAVVSLAVLLLSRLQRLPSLRIGGWVLLGCALAKLALFDTSRAGDDTRYLSVVIVGCGLLLAGFVDQILGDDPRRLRALPAGAIILSAAMTSVGMVQLLDRPLVGVDPDGVALLVPVSVFGALAVLAFRVSRDLSGLLWGISVGLAALCASEALSRHWLVLAWAALAAMLVVVARRSRELRLLLASAALVGAALAHTLVLDAPPTELFVASRHPGSGVASLLFTMAAAVMLARAAHRQPTGTLPVAIESRRGRLWAMATIAAGVGALYAASLATLEVAQAIGAQGVASSFQRGHTGVSALWGVAGLAMLYLGLQRRRPALRGAGLAVFAVSLVKLFVYDLTFLGSITRALSFLAVGFLLLFGGFLYQRLSAQPESLPEAPGPAHS